MAKLFKKPSIFTRIRFWVINKFIFKGEKFMMAMLWVNQILLGKKTFKQVPKLLKEQVAEILIDAGYAELVTDEAYKPKPIEPDMVTE